MRRGQERDGVDHKKLIKYVGRDGIPVLDNKRLDRNGCPLQARLLVIGTNGSRELYIQTGPGGDEKYRVSDEDAIEKIMITESVSGILG